MVTQKTKRPVQPEKMRSIGIRLTMAFICVIYFMIIQGAFAIYNARNLSIVQKQALEKEMGLKTLQERLSRMRLLVFKLLGTMDPGEMDRFRQEYENDIRNIGDLLAKYNIGAELFERNRLSYDKIIALHYAFSVKTARRLINTQSKEEHEKLYGLIAAKSAQFAEDARRKVAKAHGRSFYVSISLCVAALAMAFVWAYVLMHTLTDRKEAEESLRSSETQKKAILDASIDRIMLVDPSDRIIWANKTAASELGMAPEALTGRLCYELFAGRNQFCDGCPSRAARESRSIEHAVVHQQPDKENRREAYWDCYTVPVKGEDGTIVSFVQIARDITATKKAEAERKMLEGQLQQSQKMEAIGTLAGGIAHDFNNILSAVIGFTELAISDVEAGSQPEENLRQVLIAGHRAKDLVRQILTFSLQRNHERKPTKVAGIVRETLKLLKASLPSTIEIHADIHSRALVMGDATQIHQVIMNLCTNALHAMQEDGGVLTIGLHGVTLKYVDSVLVEVEAETGVETKIAVSSGSHPDNAHGVFMLSDAAPGQYQRFFVADTGQGIAPEIQNMIFDPYFSTKKKGKGTGLGLFVVLGIIKNHGGYITFSSRPGRGTTFYVYLPRLEREVPERREALPPASFLSGTERILLVDDEEQIVTMQTRALKRLGYRVTASTSSPEVCEIFRSRPHDFDLLVTDMTMPHMTGEKLASELRRIRPDLPVLICTGFSEKMTEERAAQLGFDGYLVKPLGMYTLAEKIRKLFSARPVTLAGGMGR